MFRITLPTSCRPERQYILDIIIGEFLGLDFIVDWSEAATCVKIQLQDDDSRLIEIEDVFLGWAGDHWLQEAAPLPLALESGRLPQSTFDALETAVPVLFGRRLDADLWLTRTSTTTFLGLDIFGAAFFMLSRYEEVLCATRDVHDRFPAHASVALQQDFLNRPLIDEYVDILWHEIQRLWPEAQRKKRQFRVLLSHDVDQPLKHGFSPWYRTGAAALRDALTEGPDKALLRLSIWKEVKAGNSQLDPYNTFSWLMDLAERQNLRSAFYFIAARPHKFDGLYEIEHPFITKTIADIHARGHEIGLHPSYTTYLDPAQTAREFRKLQEVCDRAKVQQAQWGGRQHFLRWRNPQTLRNWEDAGLQYDSTLGYADHDGFRCGVCREYSAYDLVSRQKMALKVRPLIVMDVTTAGYMGLGYGINAITHIIKMKQACQRAQGDFVILWHNSNLVSESQRQTLDIALSA